MIPLVGFSPALQLHVMLRRLAGLGAPTIVMQLCTLMFLNLGPINMNLDACEYFAGEQAVTFQLMKIGCFIPLQFTFIWGKCSILRIWFSFVCTYEVTSAWAGNGYRCAPFEIKLTPMMDILSVPGLLGLATFSCPPELRPELFVDLWVYEISTYRKMGNIVIKLQYMEQTYQTYQYLDQLRFCMAMLMAMMLKDNAFAMIATVCSSWVFVSRSVMLG